MRVIEQNKLKFMSSERPATAKIQRKNVEKKRQFHVKKKRIKRNIYKVEYNGLMCFEVGYAALLYF